MASAPGPIFFYTGNESPVEEYINNTGLMWELGEQTRGDFELLMQMGSEERELVLPSLGGWDQDVQLWVDLARSQQRRSRAAPGGGPAPRGGVGARPTAEPLTCPVLTGAGALLGIGIGHSVLIRSLGWVGAGVRYTARSVAVCRGVGQAPLHLSLHCFRCSTPLCGRLDMLWRFSLPLALQQTQV